jgi:signal peptide peptidase SppA
MTLPVLNVPDFSRLDDYFGPWAIESQAGAGLWDLVSRIDLAAHVAEQMQARSEVRSTLEMVPASNGKSVALLRASGVLMKGQSSLGRSTSTVQLRRDLRNAVADPNVSAIMLHIDSPGGSVSGTEALATDIREARRTKPVYAQVEDLGASAAYWLASQCDKVFAETESTLVGDIGTYGHVVDSSEAAAKQGLRTVMFRSGEFKGIGTPGSPVTEPQRQHMQEMAEKVQQSFTNDVRRGRNLSEQQLETVTRGGAFVAKDAQAHGLIDGVQSTSATIAVLSSLGGPSKSSGLAAKSQVTLSASSIGVNAMKTFEEFLAARRLAAENLSPETLAALRADWETLKARVAGPDDDVDDDSPTPRSTGAGTGSADVDADIKAQRKQQADERRRIAKINEICGTAHSDIAAQAIEDGWDPIRAENAVLKASQRVHAGPHLSIGSTGRDVNDDVIKAAMCLRAGLQKPEESFKPEVLDIARSTARAGACSGCTCTTPSGTAGGEITLRRSSSATSPGFSRRRSRRST